MTKQVKLSLRYSKAQAEILFKCQKRRRLITKGRRLGLTRGVAQAITEWLLDGTYNKVLWGDTVAGNIDRYVERYFRLIAKDLIKLDLWKWRKTDRILQVGQGEVDFRSADNPENWEGFGYDLVFLNEAGIILRAPYLWENAVQPMLLDNPKSVAIIGGTPKGRNYFWELYEKVRIDPNWQIFQYSTYDNPFLDKEEIQKLEASYSEELADQEIYGRFATIAHGAYYARQLRDARKEGRITRVPYDPSVAVDTWWDLGMDDSTSIWFTQDVGLEVHVIDYLEHNGEGLEWYAKALQDKGYIYGRHVAPHDIQVRELGTGKSRKEIAEKLGISFDVAPKLSLDDGIEACRQIFAKCWFDSEKCRDGLYALENYRRQWSERDQVFKERPVHDWASHAADAFRTFAIGHSEVRRTDIPLTHYWRHQNRYRAGFMAR